MGYAIGKTLSSELAITALNMAIATRNTDNLIHHSDQGILYTCKDYIKVLKDIWYTNKCGHQRQSL